MNPKLKDYLINTLLGQIFAIMVLSPWLIFFVGIELNEWYTWLWQSSIIALVFSHGMILWIKFWRDRVSGFRCDRIG